MGALAKRAVGVRGAVGAVVLAGAFGLTAGPAQAIVDATPPTTTATASPSVVAFNSVTVNLTATDNAGGSGVKNIKYKVNGGSATTVAGSSTSLLFTTPGTYTVQYRATDNSNNVESNQSITVYVDRTRPAVPSVDQYFTPVGDAYESVLSGTAHDNVGVDHVLVTLQDAIGTIDYTHTFYADCDGCGDPGVKDVVWSVGLQDRLPAPGNYIATITVCDLAGNSRTVGSAAIVVVTDTDYNNNSG